MSHVLPRYFSPNRVGGRGSPAFLKWSLLTNRNDGYTPIGIPIRSPLESRADANWPLVTWLRSITAGSGRIGKITSRKRPIAVMPIGPMMSGAVPASNRSSSTSLAAGCSTMSNVR